MVPYYNRILVDEGSSAHRQMCVAVWFASSLTVIKSKNQKNFQDRKRTWWLHISTRLDRGFDSVDGRRCPSYSCWCRVEANHNEVLQHHRKLPPGNKRPPAPPPQKQFNCDPAPYCKGCNCCPCDPSPYGAETTWDGHNCCPSRPEPRCCEVCDELRGGGGKKGGGVGGKKGGVGGYWEDTMVSGLMKSCVKPSAKVVFIIPVVLVIFRTLSRINTFEWKLQ